MPVLDMLTPANCAVLIVDHQPTVMLTVESMPVRDLRANVTALAKTAKAFEVPTVLSTILAEKSSGPIEACVQAQFPDQKPIDRVTRDAFKSDEFARAVEATARKKLVIAAVWTEVCLSYTALDALQRGYEVYMVVDACGGTTALAHAQAIDRLTQAGAIPTSWLGVMYELTENSGRDDTGEAIGRINDAHTGGIAEISDYAVKMLHLSYG